jgi:hypothetical protein
MMFLVKCFDCDKKISGFDVEDEGWQRVRAVGGKDAWYCSEHKPSKGLENIIASLSQYPPVTAPAVADTSGFFLLEDGSQERYEDRKEYLPWVNYKAWWLLHNAVAHPLIAVLPFKPFFDFHDWTSRKMHGK